MKDITTITTWLAGAGAVGCWYFVVAYWWTTRGDWHRTPGGRHIMQFTANLGVLMSMIVAARLWPHYPGRAIITPVAFGGLIVQVYWRISLLHRAQRRP